jgi:hypothetical protein
MKLVKEHINFERGLEPRQAMDIGHQSILKRKAAEHEWDWNFEDFDWTHQRPHHEEIYQLTEIVGRPVNNWASKIFPVKICEIFDDAKKISIGFYAVSTTGEPYTSDGPNIYKDPKDALKELQNLIEEITSNIVKEHINFERGLDPKDAMNIGDINNIEYELDTLVKEFGGTSKIEKLPNTLVPNKPGWTQGTFNYTIMRDGVPYAYAYFIKYYPNSDSYSVGYVQPSHNQDPEWIRSSARDCKKQIRKWILGISESYHFRRGLSPKAAMGTGTRNMKINFKNREEVINWTLNNLPLILETKEIPNDIIYPIHHKNLFNEWYYSELDKYFRNNIKIDGVEFSFEIIVSTLWKKLHDKGYPKD